MTTKHRPISLACLACLVSPAARAALAGLSLSVAACTAADSDPSASETGIASLTATITATATEGSTAADSESESDGGSEGSGGATTTGGPACEGADECEAGQLCQAGACVFDPNFCGEAIIDVPIVTPNVMLVLDKSGSMVVNTWDGDADPETPDVTRWYSLFNVVELITSEFDSSMNLGMVLFPSKKAKSEYNANACLVEASPDVGIGPANGATVLASMPPESASGVQIAGGTPTRAGFNAAVEHLVAQDEGPPKVVILVTDGAANCSLEAADEAERFEVYDSALTGAVAEALSLGVGTFVVGIDIKDEESPAKQDGNPDLTNTFAALNALADAGGAPKDDPSERFYNAQNQIELEAALATIFEKVVSCDIPLDPPPFFPDFVEVTVGDAAYGKDQVTECEGEDGWMFTSPDKDTIRLCGEACAIFQMTGELDAQYRCPGSK